MGAENMEKAENKRPISVKPVKLNGIPVVTGIRDNGDGTVSWIYGTLDMKSGRIIGMPG